MYKLYYVYKHGFWYWVHVNNNKSWNFENSNSFMLENAGKSQKIQISKYVNFRLVKTFFKKFYSYGHDVVELQVFYHQLLVKHQLDDHTDLLLLFLHSLLQVVWKHDWFYHVISCLHKHHSVTWGRLINSTNFFYPAIVHFVSVGR